MNWRALWSEIRLRRSSDLLFRAWRAFAASCGLLHVRFPAYRAKSARISGTPDIAPTATVFDELIASLASDAVSDRWKSSVIGQADTVRDGDFRIFGKTFPLPRPIKWCRDPRSGTTWAFRHWARIRLGRVEGVDVKDCWELNRHGHFFALAQAWKLTGDAGYARTFVTDVESWAEQNPPEMGINYASNLELGIRTIAWLFADTAMQESDAFSKDTRLVVHANVQAMARHIARNLIYTRFTGRNNHLIGDSAALLVTANHYPGWNEAAKWRDNARSVLWKAVRRQVLADGTHFERSFGYHKFVLEFLTLAIASERARGSEPPEDIIDAASRMNRVLRDTRLPDGSLPNVNDCDDGSVLPVVDDPVLQLSWLDTWVTSVCSAGVSAESIHRSKHYADAGWVIGQDRDYWWMLDNHGDPFPDSGHNHASLLQFICWLDGKPLIVDSGTYRYSGAQGLRNQLRATHGHSTILIDGRSQAEPNRAFGWRSLARPASLEVCPGSRFEIAMGAHDAYSNDDGSVRHVRTVAWIPSLETWVVRDVVRSDRPIEVTQLWHVHPAYNPVAIASDQLVIDDSLGIGVWTDGDHGALEIGISGRADWALPMSPAYGQRVEKSVIRRRVTTSGTTGLWTVIGRPRDEVQVKSSGARVGDWHISDSPTGIEINEIKQ